MYRQFIFLLMLLISFAAQARDVEEIPFDDERFADVAVELKHRDSIYYPYSCMRGKAGQTHDYVVMMYDIEPNGRPTNLRVVESSETCFHLIARRTIKERRYTKPTYEGRPVKILDYQSYIGFTLHGYG